MILNDLNIITVLDSKGNKITLQLNWDAGAEKWSHAFRVILFWLTFGKTTINDVVPDLEEMKEDINEEAG